ncbi:MAG: hypothetical protein JSS99_16785 [Actinobacteria bacterium]|nr:hypothetical protein [Actinomycetota bacterium]
MALGPGQRRRMARGALAGGLAAAVWALQQPLDKRVFRGGYDDVELLGRALLPRAPRSRWYPLGLALHVQNGAVLGAVHAGVLAPALARAGVPAEARAPLVAQAENFGLWPLGRLSDRFHPARAELPRLRGNRRGLAQATWRHLLFGVVMGALERRLNGEPAQG